jgi:hypothetical protein
MKDAGFSVSRQGQNHPVNRLILLFASPMPVQFRWRLPVSLSFPVLRFKTTLFCNVEEDLAITAATLRREYPRNIGNVLGIEAAIPFVEQASSLQRRL